MPGDSASKFAIVALLCILCINPATSSLFTSRPLLVAHRGSPCSHPEETIASYQEALKQGADYLELDLVATKDNKLVLRHDATLDDSTDVKALAASGAIKQSTDTRQLEPGSNSVTGYFVTDFSLQDLQALTAVQPLPFRSSEHNGEKIAEVSEVFAFFKTARKNGSTAGLYMELKHPQYHAALGKNMPELLMQAIQQAGVTREEARDLVVQCFDLGTLQQFSTLMRQARYDIPLVLLVDCAEGLPGVDTMKKLKSLSSEAGIGPHKSLLLMTQGTVECGNAGQSVCTAGATGASNAHCIGRLRAGSAQLHPNSGSVQHKWVQHAHSLGLVVHAWTLRNEDRYMAIDFRGDSHLEMDALVSKAEGLGIDGVFVDCPKSASRWKEGFLEAHDAGTSVPTKSPASSISVASQFSRTSGTVGGDEEVEVDPAAAISTYVIVGVLIAACGVYAWLHRQQDGSCSVNGPYKVMTSPRESGELNGGPGRDSYLDSQRGSLREMQRGSQQGQTLEIE